MEDAYAEFSKNILNLIFLILFDCWYKCIISTFSVAYYDIANPMPHKSKIYYTCNVLPIIIRKPKTSMVFKTAKAAKASILSVLLEKPKSTFASFGSLTLSL